MGNDVVMILSILLSSVAFLLSVFLTAVYRETCHVYV